MLNVLKKPDDTVRLQQFKHNLKLRGKYLLELRLFFANNGFLETDTPVMLKSPAPEDYINAPQVGDFFLRTSPELHMKRLIAADFQKIFQIGSCFRSDEIGTLHNVEFTMLEWYQSGKDYNYLLNFTKKMLCETINKTLGTTSILFRDNYIDFKKEWKIFTIEEVFEEFGGMSPEDAIKQNIFEIILTDKIEPALPKDRPVVLKDYPASMAALAKLKNNNPHIAERWELYLGGIEIANAYSELVDYTEQRKRFNIAHSNRKKLNLPEYPDDQDFFKAMKYGISEFTGIAMGIDRLIMVLCNAPNINEVTTFVERLC